MDIPEPIPVLKWPCFLLLRSDRRLSVRRLPNLHGPQVDTYLLRLHRIPQTPFFYRRVVPSENVNIIIEGLKDQNASCKSHHLWSSSYIQSGIKAISRENKRVKIKKSWLIVLQNREICVLQYLIPCNFQQKHRN